MLIAGPSFVLATNSAPAEGLVSVTAEGWTVTALAANLKDYGFGYVQLDDGYDRGPNGERSWIEKLVGMSRHISGTYSLRGMKWDTAKRVLRGISDTVAGDSYALWFHVPRSYGVAHVDAKAGLKGVDVEQQVTGESLRVRFAAQTAPVEWAIAFGTGAAAGRAQ
jgi:hypothetical protein